MYTGGWSLRICENAVWIDECAGNFPATHERNFQGRPLQKCFNFPGRFVSVQRDAGGTLRAPRESFLKLRAAGLKLKPKKCVLFQTQVNYLGQVLDKTGIRPNPKKLEVVRDWERPKTVTQVRSFTAFCNYYRKFVKRFAEVAKPLYRLTSKGVKFTWEKEHENAFQLLKMRLLQALILTFSNFRHPL